jgi:hypothetical protein
MDCIHTNEYRYDERSLNKNKVKYTWEGLLDNENNLPRLGTET